MLPLFRGRFQRTTTSGEASRGSLPTGLRSECVAEGYASARVRRYFAAVQIKGLVVV